MPRYGVIPYSPGAADRYDDRGADRISDLILRAGDIAAQNKMQQGDIWGGTVANLGQLAGQTMQEYGAQKAASEREEAWNSYLDSGDWDNDPLEAYKTAQQVLGREEGGKAFEGLMAVRQLTKGAVKTPEQAQEYLGTIVQRAQGMSDETLAKYFPAIRGAVEGFNKATGAQLDIGEAFDPAIHRPQIDEFVKSFAKQKEMKTREIKTRGPSGAETTRIVEDVPGQEFVSAPEPAKPISVGGSLVQVGPEGVTELYRAPEKPAGPGAHSWVLRDGQPVRVAESQIQPGDLPYESAKAAVKKMPAGSAETLADLQTGLDDLQTLRTTLGEEGGTGIVSRAGAALPFGVTELTGWGADAKARQATIDRVKQVIGKALEGGVLRKEDEEKYKKILPIISDAPSVAKAKIDGLEAALAKKRQRSLESLSDAGYDTTAFEARQEQAPPAAPPGAGGLGPTQARPDGSATINVRGRVKLFPSAEAAEQFRKLSGY